MNYLNDKMFLAKLLKENRSRTMLIKIISLDFSSERPIAEIQGYTTGGTINLDGSSAIRRTCSLSMVSNDLFSLNNADWALHHKVKIELGLTNDIDPQYPSIVWFPQGVFILTAFSWSESTNSISINLNAKDKMCLLNGEVSGSIIATTDFGSIDEQKTDDDGELYWQNRKYPIKEIIMESCHSYAGEPYHNIIINDIPDEGLELLEYKGKEPLYLIKRVEMGNNSYYIQGVADENTACRINGKDTTIGQIPIYDTRTNDLIDNQIAVNPTIITFGNDPTEYKVVKIEYGETIGYRTTDLVFAGDLIGNAGESITSLYDKIVNMLGEYEYFYNLDGQFVFQKKRIYNNINWNSLATAEDGEVYAEASELVSPYSYEFFTKELMTSINTSPNISNIKNDYAIWGEKTTISGEKADIHYRLAIDKRPERYTSYDSITYISNYGDTQKTKQYGEIEAGVYSYDWRELIYRMAADFYKYGQNADFLIKIDRNNLVDGVSLYPEGKTGYEQYYVDMYSLWRLIYNPDEDGFYSSADDFGITFHEVDKNEDQIVYTKNRTTSQQVSYYLLGQEWEELTKAQYLDIKNNGNDLSQCYFIMNSPIDGSPISKQKVLVSFYDRLSIKLLENGTQWEKLTESDEDYDLTKNPDSQDSKSKYYFIQRSDESYFAIRYSVAKQYNNNNYKSKIFIKTASGKYISVQEQIEKDIGLDNKDDNNTIGLFRLVDNNAKPWEIPGNEKGDLARIFRNQDGRYYEYYIIQPFDVDGYRIFKANDELAQKTIKSEIPYCGKAYNYYGKEDDPDIKDGVVLPYWNKQAVVNPSSLTFWFDFIDDTSELGKYSVPKIGVRSKVVKDTSVKSIYNREVPNFIFNQETTDDSYSPFWIDERFVKISSQGKSAEEALRTQVYNNTYMLEGVNLSIIPLYGLEPNTKVRLEVNNTIKGDYIIKSISIPLTYNGTSSISASRLPQRIY